MIQEEDQESSLKFPIYQIDDPENNLPYNVNQETLETRRKIILEDSSEKYNSYQKPIYYLNIDGKIILQKLDQVFISIM